MVRADGFEDVPNVNASHTHYTIQVGAEGGRVTYRPARGGSWVLLTDVHEPIAITAENGQPRDAQSIDPGAGCTRFSTAWVVTLAAGEVVHLDFGPTGTAERALVLERLDDFSQLLFRDEDGDGFGVSEESIETACVPPPSYVAEDGDCDDADGSRSPGSPELPNERDDDCDGQVDET